MNWFVWFSESFGVKNNVNKDSFLSCFAQLFSSEAEKLNVSKALDLSDILVPEPLPEWNIETEVSDWEAVMSCLFSTSMF